MVPDILVCEAAFLEIGCFHTNHKNDLQIGQLQLAST